MEAKVKTRLKKFLKDNKITFTGEGSSLNSDCVVFAGFALFATDGDYDAEALHPFIESLPGHNKDYKTEFDRVYDYAFYASYENYWQTSEAKKKYKF